MSKPDWFEIVDASTDHCGTIKALIQELDEFEGMPNASKLTAEQLAKDLSDHCWFGYVVLLIAPRENLPVGTMIGFAVCDYHYSTWEGKFIFVEDIYVKEMFRSQGVGLAVWKKICQRAVKESRTRLEWNVLTCNTRAINFYTKIGGVDLTVSEKCHTYGLTGDNIAKLSVI